MAAPDFTLSRLGQINASGFATALFLKIFSGEVLAAFQNATMFQGRHRMRSIASGKSAQFPAIGTTTAGFHTAGSTMVGSAINHAERVILVDNLLKADVSVANIDELMNHYDVRGPYATLIGQALGLQFDSFVARAIIRAARTRSALASPIAGASGTDITNIRSGTSGAVNATGAGLNSGSYGDNSGGNGFYFVTDNAVTTTNAMAALAASGNSTEAGKLVNAIWKAVEVLDAKNAPESGRFIAVRPAQFYLMLSNPSGGVSTAPLVIHGDYAAGNGSLASGSIARLGNCEVIKTNQLPSSAALYNDNLSATTLGNSYGVNCLGTTALVWQEQAVGTVSLADIALESEYSVARQGTLMVGKYVRGTNTLRPECAVEIVDGTTSAGGAGFVGTAGTGGPLDATTSFRHQTQAQLLPN